MTSAHVLTITDLERVGACVPQRELFAQLAPKGVPLSELEARCVEHAAEFDWDWAAYNMLTEASYDEYCRAKGVARNEYNLLTRAARNEYNRATEAASDEFGRATRAAWHEFGRARAAARSEYNRARAAASDEFDRARAVAFARLYVTERTS